MATKNTSFNDFNQSISANTSSLTINIYFSADNTSTWFNGKTLYCSCDGQNQSASVSLARGGSVNASFTFHNIPHNSDGTRTIGWSWSCATGTSALGTISDSGALTLQTIPRASQPSINTWPNNSPNFNIGDTITIHMNRKANFTHKVYFIYGNESLLVEENVVDSCTFDTSTIANELYALIPNSNTYSNVVRVETYNGSTLIGTATCNYNAKVIDANPIFNDFEYEDINSTTLALTGDSSKNVNGYSTIQATISTINKAEAQKGASMSKYMLTIGDKSIDIPYSDSESVSGSIQNAPNGTYNLYAIDSRGNTTLVTKIASENITYTPINFNSSSCGVVRNNGGVGGYAVLTLSGNIWSGNFGEEDNEITSVVYQYKRTSESSWQTGQTIIEPTILENKFTFEGQVASNEPDYQFELNTSYDFRVIINDKLSTKSIQLTPMGSAIPNISLADDGVGIMCDYDESIGGALQVAGVKIEQKDEKVLYNDTTGTNGTVNLNETSANFTYIEIFFRTNDNDYGSLKVYEPNNKKICLISNHPTSTGTSASYLKTKTMTISGTSITNQYYNEISINNNASPGLSGGNLIYITRVIGYK